MLTAWRTALVAAVLALGAGSARGAEPDLLDALRAQLGRHALVRAEFTQEKRVQGMSKPLLSEGRLVFSRAHGVLWQIERPYRASYALTGTHMIETAADGTRRVMAAAELPGMAEVSRVFRAVLGADLAVLTAQFRIEATGAPARWQLRLTPRSDALAKAVTVIVLAGGEFLERIEIDETAGDRAVIRLLRARAGEALSADEAAAFKAR